MKFYILLKKIKNKEINNFIKFLLAGLPSALLAIPMNIFLVEIGELNKTISYGIVILLQIMVRIRFMNIILNLLEKTEWCFSSFFIMTLIQV